MPQSRPTLRDVGKLAGVSHVTVSRVVRGSGDVAPGTAARVKAAIARLGYRPDPALSALAAYRSVLAPGRKTESVIAFLDRDGSPYSLRVQRGAAREAARFGYRVERFALASGKAAQRSLSRQLYHRGILGLLFGPSDKAWNLEGWEWGHFAAVSLGALQHVPAMHAVAMDYFQGAFDGCEALWSRGCRRIGMALEAHLESRSGHRWIGGYQAWLQAKGLPFLYLDRVQDHDEIRRWSRREKIDGVLTIHAAVTQALSSRKIETLFLNSVECPPELSRFALDPAAVGVEGIRCLHPLLLHREFGLPALPRATLLAARLEEPESGLGGKRVAA